MAAVAGPAVASEVFASACLDVGADAVWKAVLELDLAAFQPGFFTTSTVVDGPAHRVGSIRECSHASGAVWQFKVVEILSHPRTLGYDLVHVDAKDTAAFAPYASVSCTVTVRPVTTAATPRTFLHWRAVFSSDAHAEDVAAMRTAQLAGFDTLRARFAASAFDDNVAALAATALPASCNHVMMSESFPVQACVDKFLAAGGRLCVIDPEADNPPRFLVAPSDVLIPVCSSGQNRSQVLREVLLREVRSCATFSGKILRAHAALAGVDPYVDDAMSVTVATSNIDRNAPGFTEAFGHGRDPRIGEDEFPFGGFYEAGNPFLVRAKQWYNKNLFSRTADMPSGCRRVFLSFDKPAHAVLKRLVDAATEAARGAALKPDALSDVVVVAIPLGDIVSHPPEGIVRDSADACKSAYKRLRALLNLDALQ